MTDNEQPKSLATADAPVTVSVPVADQVREVLAALSLNRSQLTDILRLSRSTLDELLDGQEPNTLDGQRLTTLVHLLVRTAVTSANPIDPCFVRQELKEGGISLLAALSADSIDEPLVSSLALEANRLSRQVEAQRIQREQRLRDLGFDEPSDEQRREQLALNMALRDWPRD